jgi:hypothetical protein
LAWNFSPTASPPAEGFGRRRGINLGQGAELNDPRQSMAMEMMPNAGAWRRRSCAKFGRSAH